MIELLNARVATEQDVFTVRRQGRQLAASLGLSGQDQIRVAAALSEVGRRMLAVFGRSVISAYLATDGERPMLVFRATAPAVADDDFVSAIQGASGLMDRWSVTRTEKETEIRMARQVPERAAGFSDDELRRITADVAGLTAATPIEELAEHNRQLLATLGEVQRHRDELLRLNTELEETNKGVMALYTELSQELEATNRGVVALYAELDQRTTQLREASEAKTRFLANVSHELRSPVTSIVGLTRLMRDPSSDELTSDQAEQLRLVDSSARSLLGLVNELLDLAKAESGRLDPTPEPTDLKTIFGTLRGTLRAIAVSDQTTLVVDDPEVPTLHTDPIMVTQILRNLVTNGLKFTASGEVRLFATHDPEDGTVSMTVSDTGIGIPPEEQERVFEEFHQIRNGLKVTVAGTGLGLPYARRLTQILGGTLTLDSQPNKGSVFTVRLPVGSPADPNASRRAASIVLVVDDDEAFRLATSGVLRSAGVSVFEAADGRTALAAASAHRPELILLDLRLAKMDGFAVLDALGADEELRLIPVVILTAYPGDVINQASARRAAAVLDKAETRLDDLAPLLTTIIRERHSEHTVELPSEGPTERPPQ